MPKRTYQPKTKKRASQTGFLSRLKTVTGSSIISRKRRKGRAVLGTR